MAQRESVMVGTLKINTSFTTNSGEEIANANSMDTDVNDKTPNLHVTSSSGYAAEWKEKISLFTRTDLSLSIQISFILTGQKRILVLKIGI